MNRHEALQSAEKDSEEWLIGPEEHRQAVIFREDVFLQYYIELEAGGKEGYNEFLSEGKYQPYQWLVRHFVPGEEHQVKIYYTPSGELYGFNELIPESEPGNNISVEEAKAIGISAAEKMGVNLSEYELAETKKNEVLSGRIDHIFVYEKPEKLQEARFRFWIKVSGDHVSLLQHEVKIPEGFERRFYEMRSANNTIASVSQYAMLFLYGLLGIGLGAFVLLRTRYLLYKKALLWAFIVSFLGFLASFNYLPLSWIWYDTAITPNTHIMQTITRNLLSFVQNFILLAISFIVAESLTRKAFPHKVRFWKTLSPGVANSKAILGNTLGAYGLVAINLAYVLGFYLITSKNWGWWNPAGLMVDPNFIAMPLPWLSVISTALHAGFWEEALFRAIPLAGMILIGRQLKREKLFLVLGLIIQALIFSAGHANYAAQPAYARVVELIVPSLFFAFLYLRFGLYTGVILHFSFDAVLMAMYIWIMKAPGIWINRVLVLIGILLPLILILYYRLRKGGWQKISDVFLNKSWKPAPAKPPKVPDLIISKRAFNPKTMSILLIAGIIGAIAWIGLTQFTPDHPAMKLTRKQAIEIAKADFEDKFQRNNKDWRIDAEMRNYSSYEDRFVWQKSGKEAYNKAMGKYVKEPLWRISFRTFSGDVEDRAEAYLYYINNDGKIKSIEHKLPENQAGTSLSEEEARQLTQKSLMAFFDLDEFYLAEISASAEKMPERTDWTFSFKDTINYNLEEGEYRYLARVCGDQVMQISRYTYVPQEWNRQERNKIKPIKIFTNFRSIIILLLYLLIGIMGIISWSNHRFNLSLFLYILILMFILTLILKLSQWQRIPAQFSTSEPWNNQVLQFILGSIANVILLSFFFALLAGFLGSWQLKIINRLRIHNAILSAIIFSGATVLISLLKPDYEPWRIIMLKDLGDYSPFLSIITQSISKWVSSSLILIFLIHWLSKITVNGTKKRFLSWLIFALFIVVVRQDALVYAEFGDFMYLTILAVVLGLILNFIFRHVLVFDLSILPVFLGVNASLPLLRLTFANSHFGAVISNITAIILINILAVAWMNLLRKNKLSADV